MSPYQSTIEDFENMTIKPTANRVLVKPDNYDPETFLHLPDNMQKEEPTTGEVIALGDSHTDAKGRPIPWDIKPGERIAYRLYSAAPITGSELVIIKDTDVLGTLQENDIEIIKARIRTLAEQLPEGPGHAGMRLELCDYLDTISIQSDNIGSIRRECFVPFDSAWNAIVREETAAREGKPAAKRPPADIIAANDRSDGGIPA